MTANTWQKLTQRMNERTIKNPRMGAIPLVKKRNDVITVEPTEVS